jgi:hypothetical protein
MAVACEICTICLNVSMFEFTRVCGIIIHTDRVYCILQESIGDSNRKSLQGTGTFLHTLNLCGFMYEETQLVLAQNF